MTLFQDTGGDPRAAARQALADVLGWYGAAGDAAQGNPPGFGVRKAAIALALGGVAQLAVDEFDALAFAGVLHAVGAIGNAAHRKGEELPERRARMERWDVPAQGARACAAIATLPVAAADMVRWQAEAWDGTGFPDQLCWHAIPLPSQLLAVADAYLRFADPEEALSAVGLQSGRAFGPPCTRMFVTWFHLGAAEGDGTLARRPLDPERTPPDQLLDHVADRIDAHNGVPGRWRRIEALTSATARQLGLPEPDAIALRLACRLVGAGELESAHAEDATFDPLARLGIDERALNASNAARLAELFPSFAAAVPLLAARSEWYDGTGKPRGLARGNLPTAAGILAAAIAHDRLDRGDRMDEAAGTQFDPRVVRALLEAARRSA
jgi:HD-GYP domain-containing protein (c-di-GMP phosphodiesterase class II)